MPRQPANPPVDLNILRTPPVTPTMTREQLIDYLHIRIMIAQIRISNRKTKMHDRAAQMRVKEELLALYGGLTGMTWPERPLPSGLKTDDGRASCRS